MNAQEGIKAIKELLGLHFNAPAPVETTEQSENDFAESTLTDGTIIRYDVLEVGSKVDGVGVDGVAPLADGNYETTDGKVITVTDGVITSITDAVTEPVDEAMNAVDMDAKFGEMQTTIDGLAAKLQSIEALLSEASAKSESKFEALNKAAIDTLQIVESFGKLPNTEPAAKPISNKLAAKEDYLNKVADAITKFKNNK